MLLGDVTFALGRQLDISPEVRAGQVCHCGRSDGPAPGREPDTCACGTVSTTTPLPSPWRRFQAYEGVQCTAALPTGCGLGAHPDATCPAPR
jgi:hypothetical protein